MSENVDPDKYSYSWYGTVFDGHGFFSLSEGSGIGKNEILFVADNISSAHTDNKKIYLIS